jgi:hypothetical protein
MNEYKREWTLYARYARCQIGFSEFISYIVLLLERELSIMNTRVRQAWLGVLLNALHGCQWCSLKFIKLAHTGQMICKLVDFILVRCILLRNVYINLLIIYLQSQLRVLFYVIISLVSQYVSAPLGHPQVNHNILFSPEDGPKVPKQS